ncbi:branched-chain amino acid transaminase [Clostridium gasigenes]|uniref:branched-chain amino acid transaminase n=1 Tax=Clostridium gasigenes TaxID=94869 RepID=UPI00162AAD90|nr:branched-chain amino acid transaminase [Clostridium gasigenes]MBB6625633.1 branched-chain amino acid transaminase [Clostridium gasigenes]
MDKIYAFYQGKIVDEKDINISVRCKGFNYGLGCFEGIRAYWNDQTEQLNVFKLKEHFERLLRSCKVLNLNIPYSSEELSDYTVELLKKNNVKYDVYVRPIVYKGAETLAPSLLDDDNRIVIYFQKIGQCLNSDKLKVGISSWTRLDDDMIPVRVKPTGGYLNSALASLEASNNGYDEAIFLTRNGNVAEGTGENIFIYKNSTLITPPVSDNILEGITRNTIMEIAEKELNIKVIQRSITRSELYEAEEAFFTGTAAEVVAIVEIDNRVIGNGKKGDVSKKLKKIFEEIIKGENKKYSKFITLVY